MLRSADRGVVVAHDGAVETGTWRLGRRPALDGLRGVAILLVLIGHAGSAHHIGALAASGVTLFFGLSGYLITGILRDEYQRTGGIDLRRFYARRLTRLAPPLLVMLAVICLVSWPGWGAVLSAATWTANYTQFFGIDLTPLGHTWSLGVEEQFYLLWPLALLLLLPRGRTLRWTLWVTVALTAWRAFADAEGAYLYAYGALETAGSAILAGAVVALAGWRLRGMWAVVGLGGLVAVAGFAAMAGGSWWLVVPLLVTPFVALMLLAAESTSWLAWRPLVACGVASYSLYLWHEPGSFLISGGLTVFGVACGTVLGVVAYFVVEAPVMRRGHTGSVGDHTVRLRNDTWALYALNARRPIARPQAPLAPIASSTKEPTST